MLSTRTSPARRKMAGKHNRLGRVYKPGKALSEPQDIIEMYSEGFSVTEISNDVRVTVPWVNVMHITELCFPFVTVVVTRMS